jgi:hypothetical protein
MFERKKPPSASHLLNEKSKKPPLARRFFAFILFLIFGQSPQPQSQGVNG